MSLSELNKRAELVIDHKKSIRLYIRSADVLFQQVLPNNKANVYFSEHDYQSSYVLYMKYCNLIITLLPKHPQYNQNDIQAQRMRAITALDNLEKIKVKIKEMPKVIEKKVVVEQVVKPEQKPVMSKANANEPKQDLQGDWWKVGTGTVEQKQVSFQSIPTVETLSLNPPLNVIEQRASYPSLIPTTTVSDIPPPIPPKPAALLQDSFMSPSGIARTLFVPKSVSQQFLEIAKPNTIKNLETCGILCGKLRRNELFVTHLLIPPQTATSDTCSTTDEIAVFTFQDQHDLLTLGWIHTHPTQTCFMSSVDCHTQCSYQYHIVTRILMPEAIAIVCAPSKEPSLGVFRLTDPPGIDIVSKCTHPEPFHIHPRNDEIYESIQANFVSNQSCTVIDLRLY